MASNCMVANPTDDAVTAVPMSNLNDCTTTQKYRMVALDLDGTLLRENGVVSDETCEYLRHLDQQGFVVVVATGRVASTCYETVRRLNFPHPIPVVCSNGAKGMLCSVDADSGVATTQDLFYTPVPRHVAQTTIEHANALGYVTQFYVGEDVYANPTKKYHYELVERYMQLTGCKTILVEDNFQKAMELGDPSKLLVLCPNEEQDDMIQSYQTKLHTPDAYVDGKPVTLVRGALGWFMEVLHPDVNKGSGLRRMCEHLQMDLKHVIAFGDGDNDYEFLQLAGRGIVMKNGRPIVKEIANEVIDYTNEEDGVMRTLQRMEKDGSLLFK